MMQAEKADDYVIATGESHSVREFCELAFELVGKPITWRGEGVQEVGVDKSGRRSRANRSAVFSAGGGRCDAGRCQLRSARSWAGSRR